MLADMTVEELKQFILLCSMYQKPPGKFVCLFVLPLRNSSLGIPTNLEGLPEIYQIQYTFFQRDSKNNVFQMHSKCY